MKPNEVAKAIAAGVIAGYTVLQIATGTGSPAGEGITLNEWIGIFAALVFSAAGVWAVPNKTEIK
ncbi:MAG TPA: hypothetical protein VF163_11280 [Micromonosporaceae bacterium]